MKSFFSTFDFSLCLSFFFVHKEFCVFRVLGKTSIIYTKESSPGFGRYKFLLVFSAKTTN